MSGAWELEAARAVLTLREILVRHDENAKAVTLMGQCVPYIIEHRRDIQQAAIDQKAMVEHLFDPEAMLAYYTANAHDRAYEEQYGLKRSSDVFAVAPRFQLLRMALADLPGRRILDLACNDGILAAAFREIGSEVLVDGIDLGEACIQRANHRNLPGKFVQGDIMDAATLLTPTGYTDVVAFEVIEHVADPYALMAVAASMCAPGGSVWVSTPLGAVERGELPRWDHVEPKGHVRSYTPQTFYDVLSTVGVVEKITTTTPDHVMVARIVTPGGEQDA